MSNRLHPIFARILAPFAPSPAAPRDVARRLSAGDRRRVVAVQQAEHLHDKGTDKVLADILRDDGDAVTGTLAVRGLGVIAEMDQAAKAPLAIIGPGGDFTTAIPADPDEDEDDGEDDEDADLRCGDCGHLYIDHRITPKGERCPTLHEIREDRAEAEFERSRGN